MSGWKFENLSYDELELLARLLKHRHLIQISRPPLFSLAEDAVLEILENEVGRARQGYNLKQF